MNKYFIFFILTLLLFSFLNCEPVSVSVNSKGEIAFTRDTGVFYYNPKTNSIQTVFWNYPNSSITIISKWSPDGQKIAFTVRNSEYENATKIYLIDKNGSNSKEILNSDKNIIQLEWSPDGNYISYALPGADSDMGAADIGLISLKDGTNKIILTNTGDVHKWYNLNIIYMSIKEKNPDNSSMFKGILSMYDITNQTNTPLVNSIINNKGYIDCSKNEDIVFTAYKVNNTNTDIAFEEFSSVYSFLINLKNISSISQITNKNSSFNTFSPDNENILLVTDDGSLSSLELYNIKNKSKQSIINNITFKTSVSGSEISLYPCWYDNNAILFFKIINVYGANGKMLQLMSINKDGSNLTNLQPFIENWMDNEIKKKGGYIK